MILFLLGSSLQQENLVVRILGQPAQQRSCHNDDEHEEDEDDHHIEAQLATNLNFRRDAATVGALIALAFRCALTLVKVLLHTLLADLCTPRAIAK